MLPTLIKIMLQSTTMTEERMAIAMAQKTQTPGEIERRGIMLLAMLVRIAKKIKTEQTLLKRP